MKTVRFPLGQVVATPAALAALEESGESPAHFVDRHAHGDWGDVCHEDGRLNDEAVSDGSRILSVYRTALGAALWVLTDAEVDDGQRPATTILLPDDY